MSTAGALREKRRAELLACIDECERVLRGALAVNVEYSRAFAALQAAGKRYDNAEREDSRARFEDGDLWAAEPSDVKEGLDEAIGTALERMQGLRKHVKKGGK